MKSNFPKVVGIVLGGKVHVEQLFLLQNWLLNHIKSINTIYINTNYVKADLQKGMYLEYIYKEKRWYSSSDDGYYSPFQFVEEWIENNPISKLGYKLSKKIPQIIYLGDGDDPLNRSGFERLPINYVSLDEDKQFRAVAGLCDIIVYLINNHDSVDKPEEFHRTKYIDQYHHLGIPIKRIGFSWGTKAAWEDNID